MKNYSCSRVLSLTPRTALFGFSVFSVMMGLSNLRAAKWFCRDTSGFGRKSLPVGPCRGKLPFFCIFGPHPFSMCQQEFLAVWPWAVGPVQTVLGTICLTPPQQP